MQKGRGITKNPLIPIATSLNESDIDEAEEEQTPKANADMGYFGNVKPIPHIKKEISMPVVEGKFYQSKLLR